MARYTSEFTQFLSELKSEQPHLEAGQQAGRALLWDQEPLSTEDQRRAKAAKLKQRAYVYSNDWVGNWAKRAADVWLTR